ncbi:hypothetical protein Emag_006251 [Eimeria magna]
MKGIPRVDAQESPDWLALDERGGTSGRPKDRALFTVQSRRVSVSFVWASLLSVLAAVFLIAQCHVWSSRELLSSNVGRRLAGSGNDQQGEGEEDDEGFLLDWCQSMGDQPQTAAGQGVFFSMPSAGAQEQPAAAAELEQKSSKRKRKTRHLEQDEDEGAPEAKMSKFAGGKEASYPHGLVAPQQEALEGGGSSELEGLLPGSSSFEEELLAFQDDVLSALDIPESPSASSLEHSSGRGGVDILDEFLQSQLEEWVSDSDSSSHSAHTPEAPGEQQLESEEFISSYIEEQYEQAYMGKVSLAQERPLHEESTSAQPVFEEGGVAPALEAFPLDISGISGELPHLREGDIQGVLGGPPSVSATTSEQSGEEAEGNFLSDTLTQLLKEGDFLKQWERALNAPFLSSIASELWGGSRGANKELSQAGQPEQEGSRLTSPEVILQSDGSDSSQAGASAMPTVSGTTSEAPSTSSIESEESQTVLYSKAYETHLFYRLPTIEAPEPEKGDDGMAPAFWVMPRLNLPGALRPVQELLNKEHLNAKEARELINRSLTLVRVAYFFLKPIRTKNPAELCTLLGKRLLMVDALMGVEIALGPHFKKPYVWEDIVNKLLVPPMRWERKVLPSEPRRTRSVFVEYLLRALDKYRRGVRPSAKMILFLKRELFCFADSPPEFKREPWDPWRDDDRISSVLP